MGRKGHQDGNSSQAAYINKVNEKSPIIRSKRMLTTKILACDFKFFACFLLENYMYNPFPWEEIQVLYNRCEDSFLPTPVFLPGKSQEQSRLGGYSPQGHKFSQHYCCLASYLSSLCLGFLICTSHNKSNCFRIVVRCNELWHYYSLEKGMATHSSILAWRIPWQRSLVGPHPWDCKESDMTEWLTRLFLYWLGQRKSGQLQYKPLSKIYKILGKNKNLEEMENKNQKWLWQKTL